MIESLQVSDIPNNLERVRICNEFLTSSGRPKYIFGRNIYAEKVLQQVKLDGVIDDFADDQQYLGLPLVKLCDVPQNSLVLVLSGGRPLSAMKRVESFGLECIDYFTFNRCSGLELDEVLFLEGFQEEFKNNRLKYEWVYGLLADDISRQQFQKLLDFKRSYVLECLQGFKDLEKFQYFEDFLALQTEGEVFADVGSFDGYTATQFIDQCPDYAGIHVFEPIEINMAVAKGRLADYKNIDFHAIGLSDEKNTLRFSVGGSQSRESEGGAIEVRVDRLDDQQCGLITFMKIDIEGGELAAIDGAKKTIKKYHPKLAIAAYHKSSDIWAIPEKILSIESGYKIYLRHYTESIYETVMFFIPVSS